MMWADIFNVDGVKGILLDPYSCPIDVSVHYAIDGQASTCSCGFDKVHDCWNINERLSLPIFGYVTEKTVFDLVIF